MEPLAQGTTMKAYEELELALQNPSLGSGSQMSLSHKSDDSAFNIGSAMPSSGTQIGQLCSHKRPRLYCVLCCIIDMTLRSSVREY